MERQTAAGRRGRSVLFKLALVGASLIGAVVLVEALARLRARLGGAPYSVWKTQVEWTNTVNAVTATMGQQAIGVVAANAKQRDERVVISPYVGFDWTYIPNVVHDDIAYFQTQESDDAFDVMIVGGSVAAGFGNHEAGYLRDLLQADPRLAGRKARVFPYGRGGYKQPQQLIWTSYVLSLGYKPDLVLNIDGFNELALGTYNAVQGAHPAQPSIGHWSYLVQDGPMDREALDVALEVRTAQIRAQATLDRALACKLQYSAITGPLVTARLRDERAAFSDAQQRYAKLVTERSGTNRGAWVLGPACDEDPLDVSVRIWSDTSRSLNAMCTGQSIRYLHVLQPTLHDTGSKTLTEDEVKNSVLLKEWIEAVKAGYPRLREAGEKLAESGVAFFDASRVFVHVDQTLYYDGIHFSVEGNEIFARAIADAILASLAKAPVSAPTPREPRAHPRGKKKKQGAK